MKITLLGDSITMIGYGTKVPELLGSDFEVFQPADNCRFSKYTLRVLANHRKDMEGSRIVHWNNGLWDICNCTGDGFFTPEDEYVANMTRIADILLSRHEKVIFATTTPTNNHPEFMGNHNIERYNALIVPILEKKGVIINDLYPLLAADVDKYIRSDDYIHLTEAGIDVAAKQVAEVISNVASELR